MKPRVSQLGQSGASLGQTLVWDGAEWSPADLQPPSIWTPLTTVAAGVPELVWDENDELVLIEVPTP